MSLFFAEHVRRNLNYDASQLIRPRPTRPGEIIQQEIPKFATCEQRYGWIRNGSTHIINFQSPSGAKERKSWRTKIWDDANDAKFKGLVGDLEGPDCRLIIRTQKRFLADRTGYYDNRYSISGYRILWFFVLTLCCSPPNLKKNNSYVHFFSVRHGLSCSDRGLVIARHNKVHDELLCLSRRASPSQCVRGKPLIHQGRSRSDEEIRQGRDGLEKIDDDFIRGLWESQTDSIIDVRFGD